jgi:hypothetical protein
MDSMRMSVAALCIAFPVCLFTSWLALKVAGIAVVAGSAFGYCGTCGATRCRHEEHSLRAIALALCAVVVAVIVTLLDPPEQQR